MNKHLKILPLNEDEDGFAQAAVYFGCEIDDIDVVILDRTDEDGKRLAFAVNKTNGSFGLGRNGDFNLFYEENGVYLETYPSDQTGRPLDKQYVTEYIERKKLIDLFSERLTNIFNTANRMMIAPAQEEKLLSEDVKTTISEDQMEAYIQFLPGDEGGEKVTAPKIVDKLTQHGVVHGVSVLKVGEAVREKIYGKSYLVAEGTEPLHGKDGRLVYHFDVEKKSNLPPESVKGKIDFRKLDLFEPVKEGQLLITRVMATDGTAGLTVKGVKLIAKKGKEVNLPKAKNAVINPEMTTVHAAVSGMVTVEGNSVIVSDTYVIRDDCDLSTGDIDFEGNVTIGGAVISGMTVRAKGNIVIGGVVDNADIIAGGNIELRCGIQGGGKGRLKAGGSVRASFVERAIVYASKDVTADVILHSDVDAGERLILQGRRGSIAGGRASVGSEIIARTIGAPSYVVTEIEVGMRPEHLTRYRFLSEELERLDKAEGKIKQIEEFLEKADHLTPERKKRLELSVIQTRAEASKVVDGYREEHRRLEHMAENIREGKIHCSNVVHPGTKIAIGPAVMRIEKETQAATFKNVKGEITFVAYEL